MQMIAFRINGFWILCTDYSRSNETTNYGRNTLLVRDILQKD